MGHRICQWSRGLFIVLAACLILCLSPGAEAIKCKQCLSKNNDICHPRRKYCEDSRDAAVCLVEKKYLDDRLTETLRKCSVDIRRCGAEVTFPDYGFRLETNCCSDRDFCNDDM